MQVNLHQDNAIDQAAVRKTLQVGEFAVQVGDQQKGKIRFVDDAGGAYPYWEYRMENEDEWLTSATAKITITYNSDPGSGTYYAKVVIPNGIADEHFFSM